jgi:hypothetical protein
VIKLSSNVNECTPLPGSTLSLAASEMKNPNGTIHTTMM